MTTPPSESLIDMLPGETAVVAGFSAGHGVARKLLTMGIVPGRRIQKVSGGRHGPVVVSVADVAIAIGGTLAAKILVQRERA